MKPSLMTVPICFAVLTLVMMTSRTEATVRVPLANITVDHDGFRGVLSVETETILKPFTALASGDPSEEGVVHGYLEGESSSRVVSFVFESTVSAAQLISPRELQTGVTLFEAQGMKIVHAKTEGFFNLDTGGIVRLTFARRALSRDMRRIDFKLGKDVGGNFQLTSSGLAFNTLQGLVSRFLGAPTGLDRFRIFSNSRLLQDISTGDLPAAAMPLDYKELRSGSGRE